MRRPRIRRHWTIDPMSPAPTRTGPRFGGADQLIRYVGSAQIIVHGPHSGRLYLASANQREIAVDARDAAALVGSGMFLAL